MHYLLFYDYVPDMAERRGPVRPAHLELVERWVADGRIYMAGALTDPLDGAAIVFTVDGPSEVEEFVASDPYVRAGLVTGHRVRQWTVVAHKK